MAGNLISTPFYEGAPLDPNKLNDLLTDVKTTYGEAALANKTINGMSESFTVVYDCGRESTALPTAGKPSYVDISLNNSAFNTSIVSTHPIVVTATISTSVDALYSSKTPISASGLVKTAGGGTKFSVGAVCNVPMQKVNIDWIAVQKIPSSSS